VSSTYEVRVYHRELPKVMHLVAFQSSNLWDLLCSGEGVGS